MSEARSFPFIDVEGSVNLRDFGGYRTLSGDTVKTGKLFRCGVMIEIAEHAYQDFANLDIGVICDLRSHEEADSSPTPTVAPFDCRVHIPIWPGSSTQFQESVQNRRPELHEFETFMGTVTKEIAFDHLDAYRQLVDELLNTDRGFLLHCSAGKDRTGIGAAIILSALGVDRETVISDYLISNQATELRERTWRRMFEAAEQQKMSEEITDNIVEVFAGVKEHYLTSVLDQIDSQFGTMDNYLAAIGLDEQARTELQSRLLEN